MSKIEFAEAFKKRTKDFTLEIINLYRNLPKTEEARIVGRQLLRSATSVASNYRAACRARSNNEFFAKISIVVEEADETVFWLELLDEAKIIMVDKKIMKEAKEILAVVSSSRKTLKSKRYD
jgi:four helix bundle protein